MLQAKVFPVFFCGIPRIFILVPPNSKLQFPFSETIFWALDRGRDVTHEGTKIALYTPFALLVFFVEVPCKDEWWANAFRVVILIALALFLSLSPFWYLALILEAWNVKKTVAYRAELAENRRESSLSLDLPVSGFLSSSIYSSTQFYSVLRSILQV